MTDAIQMTSATSNRMGLLDAPVGNPDVEALRLKVNGLILALHRNP